MVKKNLKDSTAVLSYSLGCSIVHLSLLIMVCLVKPANLDVIGSMHKACQSEALGYDLILKQFIAVHALAFVVCIFREVLPADVSLVSQVMRIIEVLLTFGQIYIVMFSLEFVVLIMVRAFTEDAAVKSAQPTDSGVNYLDTKCPDFEYEKFKGGMFELIMIELILFVSNIVTMILLMVKSRCKKVGVDIGSQFEPAYMRLLASKIASQIDLAVPFASEYYKHKERLVQMDGIIQLKVNLKEKAFADLEGKRPILTEDAT